MKELISGETLKPRTILSLATNKKNLIYAEMASENF